MIRPDQHLIDRAAAMPTPIDVETWNALRGFGMAVADGPSLVTVGHGITPAELARAMHVKPTTMNNRLVSLERQGLATRTPVGKTDRWHAIKPRAPTKGSP